MGELSQRGSMWLTAWLWRTPLLRLEFTNPYLPVYQCSRCRFGIAVGWSHQVFGSAAFCRSCGELLRVRSKTSEWGPIPNEALMLYRYTGNRWRTTGLRLPPFSGSPKVTDEGYMSFLSSAFGPLACPSCSEVGRITAAPQSGERCPRCRTGVLTLQGSILP